MVICTVEVNEKSPQTIVIGRRGTYNTQEVVFDIGYLIDAYGAGTAVLAIKRSQDSSAYPTVVTQEDNILTWTVSETDTYYVGAGECQLMWYVDGGLAKTIIYPLVVMRDILSTSEEAPDAYQEWVDNLISLGAETLQNAQNAAQSASAAESAKDDAVTAKEAAKNAKGAAEKAQQAAETAVTHYPKIVNSYWYVWTNGEWVNTGVKAEGVDGRGIVSVAGEKTDTSGNVDTYTMTVAYTSGNPDTITFTVTNGTDGYSPVVTITTITGGHRVTITDETHPSGQSFDVMDGKDGAVLSVAGKTGNVTLDANDVAFSESGTYDDGTVGKELSDQKNAIEQKAPVIINTASGDIASFPDGADAMPIKSLVASIEPVQDLHGYDAPWPAGGGKNKINAPDITLNSAGYIFNGAVSIPAGTYTMSLVWSGAGTPSASFGIFDSDGNALVSGSHSFPYTFTLSADATSARFYVAASGTYSNIQIEPGSSATSFAPYENICPISGWTGANVGGTGINVWDEETEPGALDTLTGDETSNSSQIRAKHFSRVSGGAEYCVCTKAGSGNGVWVLFYDRVKNVISDGLPWGDSRGNNARRFDNGSKFTVPANCCYIRFYFQAGYGTTYLNDTAINYPSSNTVYHAYTGTTLPINWQTEAGTIYGGIITLNEDNSVDIVSYWSYIHLGALSWSKSGVRFESEYIDDYRLTEGVSAVIADCYKGVPNMTGSAFNTSAALYNMCFNSSASRPYLIVKDDRFTTGSEIKNYLNGHYALLRKYTYTQYHLENIGQLYTYLGTNNVWIDTGSITECDYPADTKLYIDGLTEPDEDMIANANIASGKYFVVNNQLYLSTAAIAAGASIVPGTNCTATNLAEALNALNT